MSIAEDYRIIQELDGQRRRKFGDTFIVEHKISGDKGILKAVRKGNHSALSIERLIHESHFDFNFLGLPSLLAFHNGTTETLLIRKFIKGEQIDNYWKKLKRKQQFPFLRELVQQLSRIFDHLEEQDIVHCDIKPSNLLIESTDSGFQVHLIDFGLAIRKNKQEKRETLFPLGYAAPELLLNQLDLVDQRTDIFALGIVIWRLFAGQIPLTHPNPSILTNLQLTHPLPEHSTVPRKLFPILVQMSFKHQFKLPPNKMELSEVRERLQTAIQQRYSSLKEVCSEIEKIERKGWFTTKYPFSSRG